MIKSPAKVLSLSLVWTKLQEIGCTLLLNISYGGCSALPEPFLTPVPRAVARYPEMLAFAVSRSGTSMSAASPEEVVALQWLKLSACKHHECALIHSLSAPIIVPPAEKMLRRDLLHWGYKQIEVPKPVCETVLCSVLKTTSLDRSIVIKGRTCSTPQLMRRKWLCDQIVKYLLLVFVYFLN